MAVRTHFAPRGEPSPRWTVTRRGRVVHEDSEEHAALASRVLDIDELAWRAVLDRYDPQSADPDDVLPALARAVANALPSDAMRRQPVDPSRESPTCPVCGDATQAALTRNAGDGVSSVVYARCTTCEHLSLVHGAEPASVYEDKKYFAVRSSNGAGYDAYGHERAYREDKGRRVVEWLGRPRTAGRRLLEVGSGFGYTRKAAQDAGWFTAGVDLSAHANDRARTLYGMETHVGTLAACLIDGRIAREAWDVALYQFVLEHVADPVCELRAVWEALAREGILAVIVPSANAAEIDIFQGRYRSLRADHLHVFSSRSLDLVLHAAGFIIVENVTLCSIHLLRGFLDDEAIGCLYRRGQGPDRHVLARKVAG